MIIDEVSKEIIKAFIEKKVKALKEGKTTLASLFTLCISIIVGEYIALGEIAQHGEIKIPIVDISVNLAFLQDFRFAITTVFGIVLLGFMCKILKAHKLLIEANRKEKEDAYCLQKIYELETALRNSVAENNLDKYYRLIDSYEHSEDIKIYKEVKAQNNEVKVIANIVYKDTKKVVAFKYRLSLINKIVRDTDKLIQEVIK